MFVPLKEYKVINRVLRVSFRGMCFIKSRGRQHTGFAHELFDDLGNVWTRYAKLVIFPAHNFCYFWRDLNSPWKNILELIGAVSERQIEGQILGLPVIGAAKREAQAEETEET